MIPIDFGVYWLCHLMTVIKSSLVIYWARKREIGNTCNNRSVGNTANFQINIDFQVLITLKANYLQKNDKPSTQTNSVTLKPQEKYNHFTDTANKILTTQIKTTSMYKPP